MYLQQTFADKLRDLDVYKKLPREYLQPSFLGALCKLLFQLVLLAFLL